MANELLTLPEVARQLHVTLDEALRLVESRDLPAGRGNDGGVYVQRRDVDVYQAHEHDHLNPDDVATFLQTDRSTPNPVLTTAQRREPVVIRGQPEGP